MDEVGPGRGLWVSGVLAAAALVVATCAWGCGGDEGGGGSDDAGPLDGGGDLADAGLDGENDTSGDEVITSCDVPCGESDACGEGCGEAPVFRYDPALGQLLAFPDDFFTVFDPDAVTGLRVDISTESVPRLEEVAPDDLVRVFEEISHLDGFGTSAGAVLRFTRAIDREALGSGAETAEPDSPAVFGYLDGSAFVRVPVEPVFADDDTTVILWPMRPLPPATRAIAALTRDATGTDGAPAAPNEVLVRLLDGTAEPPMDRMVPRVAEAVEALVDAGTIESADDLAALTVYTTQSIGEESRAVAEDIAGRSHAVSEHLGCANQTGYRLCTVSFAAGNYRNEDGVFDPEPDGGPRSTYELLVSVYLPYEPGAFGGPPYPTVLFAHGLAGNRSQASQFARDGAPAGIVTVSIDAPEHGDHPLRQSSDLYGSVLDFFGISASNSVNPAVLRDNFRQATWDKLALLDLMDGGLDADDDGTDDVDPERLAYMGTSLGGIMGPELLVARPDIDAAVLIVPGGRLTDVMQFGTSFSTMIELFAPPNATDGDIARMWPVIQTALERGDPVNYAPALLHAHGAADRPTQILIGMAIDDEVIPEEASFSLARALGIPQVPPVILPVGEVPVSGAPPVDDNLTGGGTAGLLQFDWLSRGGTWVRFHHADVGSSDLGRVAWLHFVETYFESGLAEIIDPYEELGLDRPAP